MTNNPHKRTFDNRRVCSWQLILRVVNDLLIQSMSWFSTKDHFNEVQSSQAHFWKSLITFIDIGQHLQCPSFSHWRNFLLLLHPLEKFPIAILWSTLSALLEDTATVILGSNLSALLGGTSLRWKHRECSLGKHLDSACSYPTRKIPILFIRSEREKSLFHL